MNVNEWQRHCIDFDKSIENLHLREDLTEDEKEERQLKMLEKFNQKMAAFRK